MRRGPEGPRTLCNACGPMWANKRKLGETKEGRMSTTSSNGLLLTSMSGRHDDMEAGSARTDHSDHEELEHDPDDPFDLDNTKNASAASLRRWRQAALVLNASRRFRYTLDLNKEEHYENRRRMIRAHAQVIRAALLFKLAGEQQIGAFGSSSSTTPATSAGNFDIDLEKLVSMTRNQNMSNLQQLGGVKGVAEKLKSNLEQGIEEDEKEVTDRKNAFGSNTYPKKKGKSFYMFLWEAWQDLTLIILIIAAVTSLALGIKTEGLKEGWLDGGSIAFAVLLVIMVTAVSDYRQSLQFQNLNDEKRNIQLEVMRGGRTVKISIYDVVVGDVIPLRIGDQVPADGVLISGHSLAIDESSMTGESKIVNKDQKSPFLMSGCKVADGVGSMLVTGVGINTEWGLLMASISEDTGEETPLQVRLNGLATFIGIVGLTVALVVLVALLVRYFTGTSQDSNGATQFIKGTTSISDIVDDCVKIFTIAVTIVVVAVPEGLPLAVTLTLAYSMRKMMADKALVRRLSACETMGSATTICSDKTGTLTLNQMTVVETYAGGSKMDVADNPSGLHPKLVALISEGVAQNTTGNIFHPKDGGEVEISGSPTEKAILSWAYKLGMKFDTIRSESAIIHAFPFNSEKKRGGVAVLRGDSEVFIHWKGAAEIVLACCTQFMDSSGTLQPIDNQKEFFRLAIDAMAKNSLRCVAIACRTQELNKVPKEQEDLDKWDLPEDELTLLAIVGIKDPCRPGVREAVRICTSAGVKVRMVTGDNLQTAKAIALECGILSSDTEAVEPTIIEGKVFRELSEKEREQVAKRITVMGRSSPNDKLLLVQALRKNGDVVAVTGDGTNDAPALHEADIGLSMGISGTEVAKESSDIIILDDNFASVVKVVRWGRSVYANIQKFIQFQLTVNVAALIINVVAAMSSGDVPLKAVQLLWVNLIMDTLGALALATEPPTDHLMHRTPVGRREPLITNIMWRNLLVQSLYQVAVLLVLNFAGLSVLGLKQDSDHAHAVEVKNTMIFNAFVMCQIFNEFNARKPDEMNVFSGVTKNPLFIAIVGVTFVLQILIVTFLGEFAHTVPLSWQLWLASIVIGLVSWPLAVVGKLIPVPKTPMSIYFKKPFRKYKASRKEDRDTVIEAMKRSKCPDLKLQLPNRNVALAVPLPLPPPSSSSSSAAKSLSELENVSRIGSGTGGTVYKVIHRPTLRIFALKVIYGHHEDNVRYQICREIEILRSVDHPNVVKCHDMFELAGEVHVLLEFMDNGSLEGARVCQEDELADLTRQILSGLAYLHGRKIVHRDIKPSNLLINSANNVKIADFGVSRILAQTMDPCNSSVGTVAYMSPERIDSDQNDGRYDGCAGDIWSLGVSILEFYLGRFPFVVSREGDWASLMCAICMNQPPEAPATASEEFRHFISCCLQSDPPKRWSAKQLLQHPFILKSTGGPNVP
ncbi:unnamed protein product [Brassica oleracea]|uniref:Calcium-transporting ATPase n=1 Tax=Brassica napus TaxID=3708 RepID=A0A816IBF3_BRANA|nr:unnamed protein product [Brassica napus]